MCIFFAYYTHAHVKRHRYWISRHTRLRPRGLHARPFSNVAVLTLRVMTPPRDLGFILLETYAELRVPLSLAQLKSRV
jgi:hypothetical protein